MDFAALVRRLSAVGDPDGALVTLGLDVSKSGVLPAATRVFLKDAVYRNLDSGARPVPVRDGLHKLARRIRGFVEKGLKEETDGLFLVAGPGGRRNAPRRAPRAGPDRREEAGRRRREVRRPSVPGTRGRRGGARPAATPSRRGG